MSQKKPSNKLNFFAGLSVGIIIILVIGLIIMVISQGNQDQEPVQTQEAANTTQPLEKKPKPVYDFDISPVDHIYGPYDALLTIVVFSDLECSYSAMFHQSYSRLLSDPEYYSQVRLVWRHFPLDSIHPQARAAAVASECASRQDKFWEFIDPLLDDQDKLSNQRYLQIAEDLNINIEKFESCLQEQLVQDIVEAHYQEGSAKGVGLTPTVFINDQKIEGAMPFNDLKGLVGMLLD